MSVYVDSGHTNCLESRRAVSGRVIQLAGASIAWFSRTPQEVVLSSSEAYYIALAEIVKEILHICQASQFITPNEDDIPIQIFADNQVVIETANNPMRAGGRGTSA